jgi:hypothetical protein
MHKKFWEELIAYFPLIPHGPHTKPKNKKKLEEYTQAHRKQTDLINLKSLKN